jgi:hypothetical protein
MFVISASGWHQKRPKTMVFQTKLPYNYGFDQTKFPENIGKSRFFELLRT